MGLLVGNITFWVHPPLSLRPQIFLSSASFNIVTHIKLAGFCLLGFLFQIASVFSRVWFSFYLSTRCLFLSIYVKVFALGRWIVKVYNWSDFMSSWGPLLSLHLTSHCTHVVCLLRFHFLLSTFFSLLHLFFILWFSSAISYWIVISTASSNLDVPGMFPF